ncbi:MAG: hypothetical protein Q9191_002674 [Dirinaria sp. TL-2023a]
MADAIGLSSALIALAATAYKSCQTLHNAIDGFRSAHEQILTLSSDLEGFYLVLGTLQTVLQDEASSGAMVERVMSEGLSKALRDSMDVFKKISAVVGKYQAPDSTSPPGTLQKAKWTFDEKKLADLRRELSECKVTLNIAISVANEYNLRAVRISTDKIQSEMSAIRATATNVETSMAEHLRQLQIKLPMILQQQEDALALGLPAPPRHLEEDRTHVRTDFRLTIRRFIDSAAASTSSNLTPRTPSFQVSSFEATSGTQLSSYYTPPMSISGVAPVDTVAPLDTTLRGRTQVFIRNAGLAKTLVFQIDSESTIEQLKSQVRDRIQLPEAQFSLVHSGRLLRLHDSDKTLRECGVTNDDTFTCVSFLARPKSVSKPVPKVRSVKVGVRTLAGDVDYCYVTPQHSVWKLKCEYSRRRKSHRSLSKSLLDPHDILLVYEGRVLADNSCVSDAQPGQEGKLVFNVLFSPDARWKPAAPQPSATKAAAIQLQHSRQMSTKTLPVEEPPRTPFVRRKLFNGRFRVPRRILGTAKIRSDDKKHKKWKTWEAIRGLISRRPKLQSAEA